MRWVFVCLLAGCASDPVADPYACMAAGGAACFELPTTAVEAIDVADNPVDPALDCAAITGTPLSATTVAGHTIDLFTGAPLPGIAVQVFDDVGLTAKSDDTVSDNYAEVTVMPRMSVAYWRTAGDGRMPLLEVEKQTADGFDALTTTTDDITALVTSVGDKLMPNKSLVITHIRDCNGNRLLNTITNVSPATGRNGSRLFEPGVRTYYYAADSKQLMRRTQLAQTTRESAAVATNLSPGHQLVQLWGFPTQAAEQQGAVGLELLAEVEVVVPDGQNTIVAPLTTSR
jgi:hypothetical protein